MTQPGQYTFVPWFRQGAAASITVPDDPDAAVPIGRASIPADLTLGVIAVDGSTIAPAALSRTVELVGPGDVRSLRSNAVLRSYPPDGTTDATANELAYVEFYEEDLPWRYTPAAPARPVVNGVAVPQLRPWLALFVLAEGEFELAPLADQRGAAAAVTLLAGTPVPPYQEAWAWAHAQLSAKASSAGAGQAVADNPDAALSRLLSPRRLRAGTAYTAMVVPAFETGRRAGLGIDTANVPALKPSWGVGEPSRRFPVYHSWRFTTGTNSTFEAIVRGLTGRDVGDAFGKRTVDMTAVGAGLDTVPLDDTMEIEGALRPPTFGRVKFPDYPGSTAVNELQKILDLGVERLRPGAIVPDPGVLPPVYARQHAGVVTLSEVGADPTAETAWVRELNLDPRERAVAGIGTQVIRDRQDDLMQRAWQQVGQLRDANQRLREAQLAVAASAAVFAKHIEGTGDDQALLLTAAAHRGVLAPRAAGTAPASVRAAVRQSAVPSVTQESVFTTVTRPGRRFVRAVTGDRAVAGFQDGELLYRMNSSAATAAPPVPKPAASVSVSDVLAAAATAATRMAAKLLEPKRVFWDLLVQAVSGYQQPDGTLAVPSVSTLNGDLSSLLISWDTNHPGHSAVVAAVGALNAVISRVDPDGPHAVTVTLPAASFAPTFGTTIASKGGSGVTIVTDTPPAKGKDSRFADSGGAGGYVTDTGSLGSDLTARLGRVDPPPPALSSVGIVSSTVLQAMDPDTALPTRVIAALPGLRDRLAAQAQIRARRLAPVLAYPTFPDPMFEELRRIDRNLVLPNAGDLPAETITLMQTNARFIEAYLAGLNTEMGRELLWREYPTDQRGSYFRVFWDRRDALAGLAPHDVDELTSWIKPLGDNTLTGSTPLVLVLRSKLLRKFPNVVVYAQRATTATGPRTLDASAAPLFPLFTATLEPDIALYGFNLDPVAARGTAPDPGWFFVLKERPGQTRFGLDATQPAGFQTWDDLWWGQLTASADHVAVSANGALQPSTTSPGVWGATAADMAAILFRSPVMFARHASDLLK